MDNAPQSVQAGRPGGPLAGELRRPDHEREALHPELVDTESSFYRSYPWCLNAFPTVGELADYLHRELARLDEVGEEWHRAEVMTNVFLLSCAIADTVDDYLLGDGYDFSLVATLLPALGPGVRAAGVLPRVWRNVRQLRLRPLREWRETWAPAFHELLKLFAAAGAPDPGGLSRARARLASLLPATLPADLRIRRAKVPAAFRSQDLTHFDILALARAFVATFPDRQRPVLVVGLRTAGSYFAPLLRAGLELEGYPCAAVTLRPNKGISRWERAVLAGWAGRRGRAVVVDEPANTGTTLARAIDLLRQAGFVASDVAALLPVHPTRRDWANGDESLPLRGIPILTLEPEQWHKQRLLEPDAVERRLQQYLRRGHYSGVRVVGSATAERLNSELRRLSDEKYHTRLKRIYEVRLQADRGPIETRYVMAKSVGWGWLGYHAFIAGDRLAGFVPPLLGLRDGILYTEWLPTNAAQPGHDRGRLVSHVASYVATRVRSLGLGQDPAPGLTEAGHHKGFGLLGSVLGRAYGWKAAAVLKRGRIRDELSRHPNPVPTLIDAKMRREEWIWGPSSPFKADFEHHGQGKTELNVTDPAYDLAEATLHFGLSLAEEVELVARYAEESGDAGVEERLFLNKLLAGTWATSSVLANLEDARLSHRHQEFNRQYVDAWNFLTLHTTRFCAALCRRPRTLRWHSPLVVMDIDGVLDKQIFGFPSTTAAGIHALSLLHAHEVPVAVNTARTVAEVKEYCEAYGFVGGVAEYGAAVWDAVGKRERALVSAESLGQLERVRHELRQIPGVFLNDGYRYSIRAYTYERGVTVPLPTALIRTLLDALRVDRLSFHQTYLDTAVVAKETDKGRGLLELLAVVGQPDLETIAIGDSEPDLAVSRHARAPPPTSRADRSRGGSGATLPTAPSSPASSESFAPSSTHAAADAIAVEPPSGGAPRPGASSWSFSTPPTGRG